MIICHISAVSVHFYGKVSNSNTSVCPPVRGEALGLFSVQADKPWYNHFTPTSSVWALLRMKYFVLVLKLAISGNGGIKLRVTTFTNCVIN